METQSVKHLTQDHTASRSPREGCGRTRQVSVRTGCPFSGNKIQMLQKEWESQLMSPPCHTLPLYSALATSRQLWVACLRPHLTKPTQSWTTFLFFGKTFFNQMVHPLTYLSLKTDQIHYLEGKMSFSLFSLMVFSLQNLGCGEDRIQNTV